MSNNKDNIFRFSLVPVIFPLLSVIPISIFFYNQFQDKLSFPPVYITLQILIVNSDGPEELHAMRVILKPGGAVVQ